MVVEPPVCPAVAVEPATVYFGAVARGDQFERSLTITNRGTADVRVSVSDLASAQGNTVFTFAAGSPPGELTVPAGEAKAIALAFAPSEARDFFATLAVRGADGCLDARVRLIGTGVDQVLAWAPATVDFGYATPRSTARGEVVFSNLGFKPVTLGQLGVFEGTAPSAVFTVGVTALTVPPATRYDNAGNPQDPLNGTIVPATATVALTFTPSALGPKTGSLIATTDTWRQSNVVVPLRGLGGGPDISITPAPVLDLGRVAYFAGQGSFANRRLTITNDGARFSVPDPRAYLRLGASGAGKPYWTVSPKGALTTAAELCVGSFDTATGSCLGDLPASSYDPAVGLEGSASIDVPVRVMPASVGPRAWDVAVFSNDPDEPVVTVTVRANAVVFPPCGLTVSPVALNFGSVTPPNSRDLSVRLRNLSATAGDTCLISNVDLRRGSDPAFTLPEGPIAERELQPGEVMSVLVRVWPQGPLPPALTPLQTQLVFNVSSPTRPEITVDLQAAVGASCLSITPSELDFGTVQQGCGSGARSFLLYNTCAQPLTVQQVQMLDPAGVPPGTPGCSGGSSCPEFEVASASAIAPGTVIAPGGAAPLSFTLGYRPLDVGPDLGAFHLVVSQGSQWSRHVLSLRGSGDAAGLNTDTFRQPGGAKADILFVIDDSGSMGGKQAALAANLQSFLRYANANQVDFHLAVTNTELTDPTHGQFRASPSGDRVFTPTTPNLATEFATVAMVGTTGAIESCMDPAVDALTAPYITDPSKNAGFLRPDAALAVVCVTDGSDQAVQPVAWYLSQLRNIRASQGPGAFTYNVIGPFDPTPPPGCTYDGTGNAYHQYLVAQTNGVAGEICTPDWASTLDRVGKSAAGYRATFYLKGRPDLSGANVIAVKVDQVTVPPTDSLGVRVWRYDPLVNAITFEPLWVPQPGQTLSVTYHVTCFP